ncbi:MAG: bifunctional DNA-formamidopyrimidine glycosylase/DNA-(apurinic or apyrimidinic site) lyase [Pseudomonadota bacterium]|nr:bifunctional DNA-formamidopyrimidine glycosylase/DNA-(apurinic or apyrimidinic site) lyase [Pseudomonadota bacterium]
MPELPEVETIKLGLAPHIIGQTIQSTLIRESRLRWPVDPELNLKIAGQKINSLKRRGKYLIADLQTGHLIIHLGMSGSLRIIMIALEQPRKHDHLDIRLDNGKIIRFHDPRRFGAILYTTEPIEKHPLLVRLGIEPFDQQFNDRTLYSITRNRKTPIKQILMNSQLIAGIGNIYANEALFQAGIHPGTIASNLNMIHCKKLAASIRDILLRAINLGGSTLRDFVSSEGEQGYFQQEHEVYDQLGKPCSRCKTPIVMKRQNGRSSFFCPKCQKY